MDMDSTVRSTVRLWLLCLSLLLVFSAAACAPADRQPDVPQSPAASAPKAIVRHIAGVRPGEMDDAAVVGIHGPGVSYGYQDQPPDTRFYTDPAHQLTLLVGTHTDGMVVVVRISQGTVLPPGVDPTLTTSSALESVDIEHGIAFGMAPNEVEGLLGRPTVDQSSGTGRVFIYQVDDDPAEAGYVTYAATYEFEDDRLQSIEIYVGE